MERQEPLVKNIRIKKDKRKTEIKTQKPLSYEEVIKRYEELSAR